MQIIHCRRFVDMTVQIVVRDIELLHHDIVKVRLISEGQRTLHEVFYMCRVPSKLSSIKEIETHRVQSVRQALTGKSAVNVEEPCPLQIPGTSHRMLNLDLDSGEENARREIQWRQSPAPYLQRTSGAQNYDAANPEMPKRFQP